MGALVCMIVSRMTLLGSFLHQNKAVILFFSVVNLFFHLFLENP